MTPQIRLLKEIANGTLGDKIDSGSSVDLMLVRELLENGFIVGDSTSSSESIAYSNVRVAQKGYDLVNKQREASWLSKHAGALIGAAATILVSVLGLFLSVDRGELGFLSDPVEALYTDANFRIVGVWKLADKSEDRYASAVYWRLFEDGNTGDLGTWDLDGNEFQLTYANGAIWNGELQKNVITGKVQYSSGEVSNFSALKVSTDPFATYISYAACIEDRHLVCRDKQREHCRVTTGYTFRFRSQCEDHCEKAAKARGLTCVIEGS